MLCLSVLSILLPPQLASKWHGDMAIRDGGGGGFLISFSRLLGSEEACSLIFAAIFVHPLFII